MLSRSFHNAKHAVKTLEISRDEAILKYSEWMTDKEVELIKKMEGKTMKNVTRKTIGSGNNARFVNIKSYEYGKGIKVKSISRKAPKVSVCKGSKKLTDRKEVIAKYVEYINNAKTLDDTAKIYGWTEKEKRIRPSDKAKIRFMLELKDSEIIRKATDSKASSKKQTSKKSKKTDSKKASKETKKESTKKASKKETKKDITKKPSTKKPSKVGVKEMPKVYILEKWEGNKLTQYQFHIKEDTAKIHMTVSTMKISRGFVIADKNLECKTYNTNIKTARSLYKAMKAEGFVA